MNKKIFFLVLGLFLLIGASPFGVPPGSGGIVPIVSAGNYVFENSSGAELMKIWGVNGSTRFSGNVSSAIDFCITSGNCLSSLTASSLGALSGAGTYGYVPMWNGTSSLNNSVVYQNGTNVGIGTTSPTKKLVVNGVNPAFDLQNVGTSKFRIELDDGNSTYLSTIGDNKIFFRTNQTTAITIDSSQNVGIGTTSPGSKLEVRGNTAQIEISNPDTGGDDWFLASTDNAWSAGGGKFLITPDGGSANARLAIDSTGKVGIGTTVPNLGLEIVNSNSLGQLRLGTTTSNYWTLGRSSTDGDFVLGDTGSEKVRIDNSGNVGIGTTAPGAKLEIYGGNILLNNAVSPYGAGIYNSNNVYIGGNQYLDTTSGTYKAASTGASNRLQISYNSGFQFFNAVSVAGGSVVTDSLAMVINKDGNVGIGTTSPQNKLNVVGDGNFTGAVYSQGINLTALNATGLIINWSSQVDFSNYFNKTDILGFGYYNSTSLTTNSQLLNGNNYWNATFATFNKTYADTLYSGISEPLWTANFTAYNTSWSSTYNASYVPYTGSNANVVLGNYNLTVDTDTLFVNSNTNNIGIGTASPPHKLTVDSNSVNIRLRRADATRYRSDFSVTSTGLAINAYDDTGGVYSPIALSGSTFSIKTGAGGSTQGIFQDSSGNMGIGTTTPQQKLHVNGSMLVNGTINSTVDLCIQGGACLSTAGTGAGTITGAGTAMRLPLWNGTSSLNNSNIYQGASGNIGIGADPGVYNFSVGADSDSRGVIGRTALGSVSGLSDYAFFSHVDKQASNSYAMVQDANGATFINSATGQALKFLIGGSTKMTLDSSGNVGIGDTTPDSLLDVEGTLTVNQTNAQAGRDMVFNSSTGTGNVIFIIG